jgi:hypothetical protein
MRRLYAIRLCQHAKMCAVAAELSMSPSHTHMLTLPVCVCVCVCVCAVFDYKYQGSDRGPFNKLVFVNW